MLLSELFEDSVKHVTFCFGRMNPPTIGHKQVLDTMKAQGGDMKVFVSQTQDKKKNPLDYVTKIEFIKEMFAEYANDVVEDSSLNTVVKTASYLHDQGYTAATFVAGSDRLEDMKKLLTDYNGVEGKSHGYYKFEVLDFVSSGEREDGAEGVAGVSASGARAAAANGDLAAFKEATGAGELAEPLYTAVRKGMGITEDLSPSEKIRNWKKSETDTDIRTFQGHQMKFAKDGLMIYKGGDLVFKREGDFSNPTNNQIVTAKMAVSRLLAKESLEEDWRKKLAALGMAGMMGASGAAGAAGRAPEAKTEPIVATIVIDGEVKKLDLTPKGFADVRDAEKWIAKFMKDRGIMDWQGKIERGEPGTGRYQRVTITGAGGLESIQEAPIDLDPADPMDPMIYGHDKANPGKLKYRMSRAAGQLKDLASRVDGATPEDWQRMAQQFEELKMNMEQIRHALEELGKVRKKGGIRSRGITV